MVQNDFPNIKMTMGKKDHLNYIYTCIHYTQVGNSTNRNLRSVRAFICPIHQYVQKANNDNQMSSLIVCLHCSYRIFSLTLQGFCWCTAGAKEKYFQCAEPASGLLVGFFLPTFLRSTTVLPLKNRSQLNTARTRCPRASTGNNL